MLPFEHLVGVDATRPLQRKYFINAAQVRVGLFVAAGSVMQRRYLRVELNRPPIDLAGRMSDFYKRLN